jgi:hypothetical protein
MKSADNNSNHLIATTCKDGQHHINTTSSQSANKRDKIFTLHF